MEILFGIFGGIGLFVLGMALMTEGLKDFAGDYLRIALLRFTATPLKGFFSGAFATALVQSSSATTIMVISFVSAGLMSFSQALGVVIGASLGTTATSWIVAWIGLKIKVGLYALPILGIAAFLKVLGRGRWKAMGGTLAGFALIFVGIDTLQTGMSGLTQIVDVSSFAQGGIWGTGLAILIGALMTVIMQSSSAAVATTLTALGADAIRFEQAAAVVIGASIGTTVTGALASIGGSTPARRTALGHILFNSATGIIAILLLPILLALVNYLQDQFDTSADATGLALFHTLFVALGALIFLPFIPSFGRLVENIIPDKGPQLTKHLDQSLTETPAVALAASQLTLIATLQQVVQQLNRGIGQRRWDFSREETENAVNEIQSFLESVRAVPDDPLLNQYRINQLHAIDHLTRLESRLNPKAPLREALTSPELSEPVAAIMQLLHFTNEGLTQPLDSSWLEQVELQAKKLNEARSEMRPAIIQKTARGSLRSNRAIDLLDAYRYLERVAYHIWRCCVHLQVHDNPPASHEPAVSSDPLDDFSAETTPDPSNDISPRGD